MEPCCRDNGKGAAKGEKTKRLHPALYVHDYNKNGVKYMMLLC